MPAYTYQSQGTVRGTLLTPKDEALPPKWIALTDSDGTERRVRVTLAPALKKWLNKPANEGVMYSANVWRCYPRFVKVGGGEGGRKQNFLILYLFAIEPDDTEERVSITGIVKRLNEDETIVSILVPRNIGSKGKFTAGIMLVFLPDGAADSLIVGNAVEAECYLNGSRLTAKTVRDLGKPVPFRKV